MKSYSYLSALFLAVLFCGFVAIKTQKMPQLGIVTGLQQDSIANAAGFKMIGESVRKMLSPSLTDDQFQSNLKQIKNAKCAVVMCNLFFPATLKIAGPDVVESKVLAYADSVLFRAEAAGVKYIVLGSGGSRDIPEGYDLTKAESDFVMLGKKLGAIAGKHRVIIALENLEQTETNFITSLKSAAGIVRRVDNPNFRLNADIFHMMREGELPGEIIAAGDLISFCELAEKENRTLPGVAGDNFKPYLRALKKINYNGFVFIEGSTSNPVKEIPLAFKYLSAQIAEVYAEK